MLPARRAASAQAEIGRSVAKRQVGGKENVALDAPLGTDEKRLNLGMHLFESSGDRESGIQMSASTAAGEEHPRHGRLRPSC